MKTIKIVGVPEHFNLPWLLAIQQGTFAQVGIDLKWTDIPEGTGKMCQMLRDNEADIAVILTEGIVKDITHGNPSSIIQIYVESPLIWGIHVGARSNYHQLADLEDTKVAISRYGSGSHLMAYINAQNENWNTETLQFEIVNTIDGAVDALTEGSADYFMWEHFMTKPLVDKGIFRRVADCPTPWPCFVIAVRNEFLANNEQAVRTLLTSINKTTSEFKNIPGIDLQLASKYNQKIEDIQSWLTKTVWSQKPMDATMLNNIQNQLFDLKIIDKKATFADIVKVV
jgi:ABC-type nitrate/sulfonate/bicarbonate transport system substrate-binding protein